MHIKPSTSALLLVGTAAASRFGDTGNNGLRWSKNALRMNQIQVIGTHNSYRTEPQWAEHAFHEKMWPGSLDPYYSHAALDVQLAHQQVRSVEIDLWADPNGGNYAKPFVKSESNLPFPSDPAYQQPGIKVMHVADEDVNTTCTTLISCLELIKKWLGANPHSVPIPIMMEFKEAEEPYVSMGGANSKLIKWNNATLLDGLDKEIRSVFSEDQIITPDDLRRKGMTLEESVLKYGWPDLDSARGKVFFLMDQDSKTEVSQKYKEGKKNLEGRVLFTNGAPGTPDCAFQKLNEPVGDENLANIQKQVRAGYWVRTRSDVNMKTVIGEKCSTVMRDAALKSGAQIVSTDFPVYGMSARWGCDYAATVGGVARCNPVNGGRGCENDQLESKGVW